MESESYHAHAASQKQLSSSEFVHAPQAPQAGNDLADVENSGHGQLHLIVETHRCEQSWRVVDQSVNTDKLSKS